MITQQNPSKICEWSSVTSEVQSKTPAVIMLTSFSLTYSTFGAWFGTCSSFFYLTGNRYSSRDGKTCRFQVMWRDSTVYRKSLQEEKETFRATMFSSLEELFYRFLYKIWNITELVLLKFWHLRTLILNFETW